MLERIVVAASSTTTSRVIMSDGFEVSEPATGWTGTDSAMADYIAESTQRCLNAYRENPLLVLEHANIERSMAQGGYGRRQIYELVQNGADALLGTPSGTVQIVLTATVLYAANGGRPITRSGIEGLLSSYISRKRGAEIGRFGLGFKSVLGITDRPEVYSRSGSFGFNAEEAAERIWAVVPDATQLPILRIAHSLDPYAAAEADPILAELMASATTVVKLPRTVSEVSWLGEDLKTFPAEFLLFCPHIDCLRLEDRTAALRREIRLVRLDGHSRLEEGDRTELWKIFQTIHTPSQSARKDAGEFAEREELPVIWAVPLQGRATRGQFWAFAPTQFDTTLSGIVNAPWKTNEDRHALLDGPFNRELVDVAAKLVADSLPQLMDPSDPGKYLDLLPGRGREAAQWADAALTEKVYDTVARQRCIPDQVGVLRFATALHLPPAGLPEAALKVWAAYPARPPDWCHPSVETRERRSRVDRLMAKNGRPPESLTVWLEALTTDGSVPGSAEALRAAAIILRTDLNKRAEIAQAKILLTAEGILVAPKPGTVFLPSEEETLTPNVHLVHPALMAQEDIRRAVQALDIREVDPSSELQALLTMISFERMQDSDWDRFWRLVRRVPLQRALELIVEKNPSARDIRVRTLAGRWRALSEVLLPGAVVPDDGSRDREVTVDIRLHNTESPLLPRLGGREGPTATGGNTGEKWFAEYRRHALNGYMLKLKTTDLRPPENALVFSASQTAGPLDLLAELSEEGRIRYTERLLQVGAGEERWTLAHRTQAQKYPAFSFEQPYLWWARQQGRLRTSLGTAVIGKCVGPLLRDYRRLLPVVDCSEEIAQRLKLPSKSEDLPEWQWEAALLRAEQGNDDTNLGRFYTMASAVLDAPDVIRCRVGKGWNLRPPAETAVVTDPDMVPALELSGQPFLPTATPVDAAALVEKWGLQPTDAVVTKQIVRGASGAEVPLSDQFPALDARLSPNQKDLLLVPCSSLRVEILTTGGKIGEEREVLRVGRTVYFVDRLNQAELLDRLASELRVYLSPDDRKRILEHRKLAENRARRLLIADQPSLAGKLLVAVGAEAIRRRLPTGLSHAAEHAGGPISDEQAAEMALAVYGVETLHVLREELARNGFTPPQQWAGSHNARIFVTGLGFPKEYAGFEQLRLDRVLEVEGPPNLPPLHAFQEEITRRLRALPQRGDGRRGLLSLPTGAGKTRVMVEALTLAVKEDGLRGPILWIAQSEELCEQAVQTWSYVWRARGPLSRLHINRLWASNEADSWGSGTQVVVATVQKLQGCIKDPEYKWLADPSWVIIDEAHTSTEPMYTAVLEWLGMGRGADRRPFVGLTATPFRGGEEETTRLVNRYGRYRIDDGVLGDEPYSVLQEMGVLAHVEHKLLAGSTVNLTAKELEELQRTRQLPASVGERVGRDTSRNETLLESIRALPSNWPVLLFATSVDHAQSMAALLSLAGISAAAISGETDAGARRHYIEAFRRGEIRVLTNYNVLTAGFDAPAVRAVYVARPTYSPVRYQQMIGRGLRGPLNGGKERCLIVNVSDNLVQFGEALAFRQFEYLWSRQ
jgi:superfamily II DNA or RNA helicase